MKERVEELTNDARKFHQIELIRRWKAQILRVAREEMQHLTYANNLLIAVGGAPYFVRPNFPNENRFYKKGPDDHGLPMSLEAFNLETVDRFIRFETSEVELAEPDVLRLLEAIPDPNYYETLHEFYTSIRNALTEEMIVDVSGQYDPLQEYESFVRLRARETGAAIPNTVRNAEEARELIDEIMLQGEGASPDDNDPRAHVNIFRKIREQFLEERAVDPHFEPGRNVISNPLIRRHSGIPANPTVDVNIIPRDRDGGLQHKGLQLFAGAYQLQIVWLKQLFARKGSAQERRAIETLTFLPYMSEVIRPLSEILTLIPAELGQETRLGPTFEVTSNNFLLPSDDISPQMTQARLQELESQSRHLVEMLNSHDLGEPAELLSEVKDTFRLFREEFHSRVIHGWPLDFGWPSRTGPYQPDTTYSESGSGLWQRPGAGDRAEWVPPAVLELEFSGWAQCRLATDPDGAFIRRGVTGNAFAIGGERDLDRVIRFQPDNIVPRSHCPPIGVTVKAARLLESALHAPQSSTLVEELVGARVDLLGEPKLEGRNHLVAEDGEPVDPFDLQMSTDTGVRLRRTVIGPPVNNMSPRQRRGTSRFPVYGAQVLTNAMRDNLLGMTDIDSPKDLVDQRMQRLRADLAAIPEEEGYSEEATALKFRLQVLANIGWDKPNVRWTRFFFDCEYHHTLSGRFSAELAGLERQFTIREPQGEQPEADRNAKWLISYKFGFYDTDALAFFVRGMLRIPLRITQEEG